MDTEKAKRGGKADATTDHAIAMLLILILIIILVLPCEGRGGKKLARQHTEMTKALHRADRAAS